MTFFLQHIIMLSATLYTKCPEIKFSDAKSY